MKTKSIIVTLVCAILFATQLSAQQMSTDSQKTYYIEINEVAVMGTKSVSLDFGKDAPFGKTYKITDEKDEPILFQNAVAALNYMSSQGWELVTVSERIVKTGTKTVYLMKYDASAHPRNNLTASIDEAVAEFQNK